MISFSFTNIGPRKTNEDSFTLMNTSDCTYICIADGVGGSHDGGAASSLAVTLFESNILSYNGDLIKCLDFIQDELIKCNINSNKESLTTFTAAHVTKDYLKIVHIGDTRICVLRGNGLKQLTVDQSEVSRLIREGKLSISDRQYYPRKNIIEHALGRNDIYEPQLYDFKLEPKDRLIFSTDGFHDLIPKIDIRDISIINNNFEDFNSQLVFEINSRELFDNTTYVSIEI